MPSALVAHEQAISRIFSNDYVFRIPSYQRPYAWTTEQARDLFDDLVGFMNASGGTVEEMPPYFLGSIVLIKSEVLPNADVVDGQQRLTTLTLLLSAIRANVTSGGADITQLIYEKGSQILGTQDRFRLSLRPRDQEFFQRYVQKEDGFAKLLALNEQDTDSRNNIRNNALLFNERLQDMSDAQRLALAQFIVTRCFLVAVATPDLDSAYRIFSILNSRGLDLSPTDILKAEILGKIADVKRDAYTKKWEDLEDDLGREAFGDLFSHIRMVYRKAKPQGTLLKEFRDHVAANVSSEKLIDDILTPMGDVYEELTDAAYTSTERAEAVNKSLKWLNRLEFNDWMPPDYETITVEHVLPQQPPEGSEWVEWFPDPSIRASIVHTLGNLALLTRKKNSSASNYDFAKKKSVYFARDGVSPFVLTTQVLRTPKWTLDVVAARQAELMERLEEHWRLQDREDPLAALLGKAASTLTNKSP